MVLLEFLVDVFFQDPVGDVPLLELDVQGHYFVFELAVFLYQWVYFLCEPGVNINECGVKHAWVIICLIYPRYTSSIS